MRRVCVFVDGSNFYHRVLKKLSILESRFDFQAFAEFLCAAHMPSENHFRHFSGILTGVAFDQW